MKKSGNWRIVVFCTLLCTLYVVGCGGKRATPAQTFAPSPDWIHGKTSNSLFYYGIGGPSPEMADAKESARAELIKVIEVQIDAEVIRIARAENEEVERLFIDRSRSYATQKLPEVQIAKTYTGAAGHYALARLQREVVANLLEEAAQESQRDVLNRVQHGDRALETGEVIVALREYDQASRQARTLPSRYNRAPENPDALWTTEIERKVHQIQDGIQIQAISGNEQTGTYGRALALPLIVQARYKTENRQMPLKGFPLQAIYTRGTGRLKNAAGETGGSIRLATNPEGKATCWVDTIASISRENLIRISADAEAIQLPLVSDAVTFRYGSSFPTLHSTDTPLITLNGSADEQEFVEGETVSLEIRVPKSCHAHLLSVLADGHFSVQQSVRLHREYHAEGWRILPREAGWALQIDTVPVTVERGVGIETLLIVTTAKDWKPTRGTLTTDGLLRQLNESVGDDNWRVGWVSYRVKRKSAE
ncbi:MAG: hypothetical protein O7E52_23350 [Candidatus Poribacteria bacterium]|nr:hypothetical protein [Candidatus Poribacteria bacterium]